MDLTHRALLAESLRTELGRAGKTHFVTMGTSMGASLPPGSLAEVSPLETRPSPNDWLVFVPAAGPLLCCHRVIAVDAQGAALTRGDAHLAAHDLVTPERCIGVVRHYRHGNRDHSAKNAPTPGRARAFGKLALRACRQHLALTAHSSMRALRNVLASAP